MKLLALEITLGIVCVIALILVAYIVHAERTDARPQMVLVSPESERPSDQEEVYVRYASGSGQASYRAASGDSRPKWIATYWPDYPAGSDLAEIFGREPIWWARNPTVPAGFLDSVPVERGPK